MPSKKTRFCFYHSNGHKFLSINICCFSLYKLWFLYHLGCSSTKNVHFSTWSPRFWNTREVTTQNDFFGRPSETSDFFSMTSSELVLKKSYIFRNEKPYPWNRQFLNYFRAPFFTNFNSMSNAVNRTILIVFAYLAFQNYNFESIQRFRLAKN